MGVWNICPNEFIRACLACHEDVSNPSKDVCFYLFKELPNWSVSGDIFCMRVHRLNDHRQLGKPLPKPIRKKSELDRNNSDR